MTFTFTPGPHDPNDDGLWNPLEAVASLGGDQWTERPARVPPSITRFVLAWNDTLDGPGRTKYLGPFVMPLIDGVRADDGSREQMAAEWLHETYRRQWEAATGLRGMGVARRDAQAVAYRTMLRVGDSLAWPCIYDAVRSAAREAALRTGYAAAWLASDGRMDLEMAWWLWEQVNWAALHFILTEGRDHFRRSEAPDYQSLYTAYSGAAKTTIQPVVEAVEAEAYRLLQQMVMG